MIFEIVFADLLFCICVQIFKKFNIHDFFLDLVHLWIIFDTKFCSMCTILRLCFRLSILLDLSLIRILTSQLSNNRSKCPACDKTIYRTFFF